MGRKRARARERRDTTRARRRLPSAHSPRQVRPRETKGASVCPKERSAGLYLACNLSPPPRTLLFLLPSRRPSMNGTSKAAAWQDIDVSLLLPPEARTTFDGSTDVSPASACPLLSPVCFISPPSSLSPRRRTLRPFLRSLSGGLNLSVLSSACPRLVGGPHALSSEVTR